MNEQTSMFQETSKVPIWERKGLTKQEYIFRKSQQMGKIVHNLTTKARLANRGNSTDQDVAKHPDITLDTSKNGSFRVSHTKQVPGTHNFETVHTLLHTPGENDLTETQIERHVGPEEDFYDSSANRAEFVTVTGVNQNRGHNDSFDYASLNSTYTKVQGNGLLQMDRNVEDAVGDAAAALYGVHDSIAEASPIIKQNHDATVAQHVNNLMRR